MKVSVIIPVYNAEGYLRECVDSILRQSHGDLEILLIDDGSTDGSGALCDGYAAAYPRVQVRHRENGGPCSARNDGLRMAEGECILFVDADDFLPDADAVGRLVSRMEETGCDIAVGGYVRLWGERRMQTAGHGSYSTLDRRDPHFRFAGFFLAGDLSYVWGKAYRKSFLDANGIAFSSYTYAEDKAFNMLCYADGARYAFLDSAVYVYRKNEGSISHRYRCDSAENWMRLAGDIHRDLEKRDLLCEMGDMVAVTLALAAFFDGKMEYVHRGRRMAPVKDLLGVYARNPLVRTYADMLRRGGYLRGVRPLAWRLLLWGFAAAMHLRAFGLLALGIKMLVDLRIDERLSDTGLRSE